MNRNSERTKRVDEHLVEESQEVIPALELSEPKGLSSKRAKRTMNRDEHGW
jgi:hypothetical protein